jgi:hypothetical protein
LQFSLLAASPETFGYALVLVTPLTADIFNNKNYIRYLKNIPVVDVCGTFYLLMSVYSNRKWVIGPGRTVRIRDILRRRGGKALRSAR